MPDAHFSTCPHFVQGDRPALKSRLRRVHSRMLDDAVAADPLQVARRHTEPVRSALAQGSGMIRGALSKLFNWANQPLCSGWERARFMLVLALVIDVRIPNVWTQGRFWAEEGTVFFRKAWNLPWWEALLAPHAGYLNLVGNAAALLAAHLTTLRAAPYVTTTIGVIIQCLPAMLLSTSRDKWLQSRLVLVIASAVIVCAPVPEEVWANSADSHFHLALCVGLILAIETQSGVMGKVHGCVILLAALSGPAAWSLIPLYALRAVLDRSKPRALQGLMLLLGAMIQIAFFAGLGSRDSSASPSVLGAIVLAKHVLTPLLGHRLASAPVADLRHQFESGSGPLWPLALVVILFAIAFVAAASRPTKAPLWLLVASLMLAATAYLGSLGQKIDLISVVGGGRYAFAPQVLIGLALLSWTVIYPGRLRVLSGLILVWIVGVGGWNYFVPTFPDAMAGPVWRDEVEDWQSDPRRPLQIWPTGWTMRLSAR